MFIENIYKYIYNFLRGGQICLVLLDFLLFQEDLVFLDLQDYQKIQVLLFLPQVLFLQKLLSLLVGQVVPLVQQIQVLQKQPLHLRMLQEQLLLCHQGDQVVQVDPLVQVFLPFQVNLEALNFQVCQLDPEIFRSIYNI